ncbi:helix-loop-helix DNA-binding domain protein [Metarhizium robertsii]|uniref:Phosphorus acquisition-controlling protein n=2 Tax=Metarhizium robertsii TaxID=568076 RepID=E9EVX3_METRA|nr:phosphorus acquisition-controlling protein [Metarhizium robertsii ARSEF 23]EFZ00395.2 phosphorus acquisition-controlling protein [Metarhizium robertsii ARSEF 23]EXV02870.1 helix-loop-helix DNA-binding domain protein [Metarhizium robertsii]
MASAAWDGQDQHMASTTEDEFNQFLDMSGMGNMGDGMQFDFHGFQDGPSQAIMAQHQHPQHQHRQQADAIMGDADPSHIIPRSDGLLQNHTPAMATTAGMQAQLLATSAPSDTISSIDAQIQYLQQQKFHQQQRQLQEQRATFFANQSHSVPPTPQSMEMPPGSGQFYSQPEQMPQRAAYDRGYHQRMSEQQDMAFTPLVSPAVTPLDPHFNIENAFTVPGAYFSPLTSPALHAQNDSSSVYDHSTQSNNSPVEMDLEAPAIAPTGGSSTDLSKKARKNNAVKARGKGVKNSPIAKPQRRKTGPSPAIVSQVLNEVDERNAPSVDQGLLPLPATSTEGSEENASVSPENLSEMPPPPVPARRSTSKSPYIQAQNGSSQQPTPRSLAEEQREKQQQPHPATPASLMKLPASKAKKPLAMNQEQIEQEQHTVTENIESLELPESISNRPLAPINTSLASPLSRIEPNSARSTSQQPLHSPNTQTPGTASASQSPQLRPGSSGPSARKTPQLASRNGRKRSTGSVHASPALLPRISPNIKPLLPGTPGLSMEDTASRLLMTKSNYQNILEGNTVPGVSYPTELSTNLTSKRTSHKIAEQGRRNRINSALQVMASLLPDPQKLEDDEAERKDNKLQNNVPNSKASVVENAIVHMKHLQKENGDLRQELDELKSQLQKLQAPAT